MSWPDANTVLLSIVSLVGIVLAYYARVIHISVNSERTALVDEVRALRDEIRTMSIDKATTAERDHPTRP